MGRSTQTEREITVDPTWFVQLMEYLYPEERWLTEVGGLVLYTYDFHTGENRRLIFHRGAPQA